MRGELADLARLSAAASQAAEGRLLALGRHEADLRARLADLDAQRSSRAGALAPDLALRAGADPKWEGWIDRRRAALLAELARHLARMEAARADLRRAFGRRTAAEDLAARARRDAAARRLARDERGW